MITASTGRHGRRAAPDVAHAAPVLRQVLTTSARTRPGPDGCGRADDQPLPPFRRASHLRSRPCAPGGIRHVLPPRCAAAVRLAAAGLARGSRNHRPRRAACAAGRRWAVERSIFPRSNEWRSVRRGSPAWLIVRHLLRRTGTGTGRCAWRSTGRPPIRGRHTRGPFAQVRLVDFPALALEPLRPDEPGPRPPARPRPAGHRRREGGRDLGDRAPVRLPSGRCSRG